MGFMAGSCMAVVAGCSAVAGRSVIGGGAALSLVVSSASPG